ncbi:uncharacterized protein LACBIDRAFT_318522 [Laccaria bicolor S238N-H82]|uniref:Predicted protein n=1 Tax=Laccaria bicolor (strain S238N-H82 / ATCC MYA-4686) TaxID=486041 RepID=B0E2L3_LACBS|nr:uncharacterized protein LACBIDRAFT_318522 [Laccaria bicolor S238N-H82]EDQ98924.1 predicted protein [Laccaria bicolor S238N-H82]|eukprot:XP_001890435.1 predicted protein [Laccaria bicolor S238N-H82]
MIMIMYHSSPTSHLLLSTSLKKMYKLHTLSLLRALIPTTFLLSYYTMLYV